jgi:hypothetical protein
MANTTEFYFGTDWESSSGPILSRAFILGDLWPVGDNSESDGAGDKDTLADGLHPFVAIGPKTLRPVNLVGVVMTYHLATGIAEVNLAPGFCAKAYVANVLTYNGGNPATFDQSLAIGEPVYLDDSDGLESGITLSRSPLNDDGNGNPRAGYLFYDQDDYPDFHVGGPNVSADWPKVVANSLVYTLVTVLLWPDAG